MPTNKAPQPEQPEPQQPQPSGPTFAELSAEWQQIVRALHVASTQLVIRLAALEQYSQIGPEAAKAYRDWATRVQMALANVPPEAPQE